MNNELQIEAKVIIDASLEKVWDLNMDILKIPEYHPDVKKVEFISGNSQREEGVIYQLDIIQGKGKKATIEKVKVVRVVPYKKLLTIVLENSSLASKLFSSIRVETLFKKITDRTTKIIIHEYLQTKNILYKFLFSIGKGGVKNQIQSLLDSMKKYAEQEH